ncbi:sigma-70 family RNA polymerase sigma factor [Nannocystis sp. ILAH1]|uniref:sigma-70 family RNA polymerase sigma factor n=1 Tax=unclassified Nannocystis TaxID=2627009 RepID=UPI002271C034|nr:sigma-70 family RNA polymerase sigma factor [Nannocystis sp. ILAH1]MCY1065381.1 sigma-70 family RNA polymerase sigma factor [Nannocystis sp. RBIL2]
MGATDIHAIDLALASECAAGDARAIATFEQRFGPVLRTVTARFATDPQHADELRQLVRVRLLTGTPPRISQYTGRGHFENWLRVAALRVCLNAQRGQDPARPNASTGGLADLVDRDDDVELNFLKAQYRDAFRAAITAAVRGLESSERAVLRLGVVHRLSIDQLCVALGIHRATAARRLAKARERLVERTLAGLKASLALDDGELASLQRDIDGQVEITLSRLLAETEP